MPPREVLVTYTLYPTGNGDVRSALAGLQAQCPLRNLHWKPTSRTALRTIQEVDIKLVDLGELPPSSDKPGASVLEHPLVNICFVACDVSTRPKPRPYRSSHVFNVMSSGATIPGSTTSLLFSC